MSLYHLESIFKPESIAVIGASRTEGSIGRALMQNLRQAEFAGDIYPVNPKYDDLSGYQAYPAIGDVPAPVDLAIIAVPIGKVPGTIEGCVDAGVKGSIIISAGGKETGDKGRELEEKIQSKAQAGGLRIIGPNCMGIICPDRNLNASFAAHMPLDGSLAFISQSGAICSAMLDLSLQEKMGFRYFISIGSMLDVDFADLLDYVGNDPQVKSVLLYIESLTNFRKFMSAARAVSRMKPVIILKSGRSEAGAEAAASHTGALAGADYIYDAAFQRAGTVRVDTLQDFFNCAELLAKQARPTGKRMTIVSNSGGPAVMATDTIAQYNLQPGSLSEATIAKLDEILPPHWSRANPIDILGDATAQRYAATVKCLDPGEIDGLLVILNPQAMTDPAEAAEALIQALDKRSFIVFACWMGGRDVQRGIEILNNAGIPTYDTPEQAIKSFMYLYHYAENLKMLQEIPPKISRELHFDTEAARQLIDAGLARENGLLTEIESKQLLAAYGIPVNRTETAASLEAAQETARQLGYPLAMKISSPDISHKSDADGVQLDLRSDSDLRQAYQRIMCGAERHDPAAEIHGVTLQPMSVRPDAELLVGAKQDPNFGPAILFGMGGIYSEIIQDRNIGLVPLNRLLAARLMEGTRIWTLLQGYRNRPAADFKRLEELLICLSQLVTDFPEISELDMNPVVIEKGRPLAVDARVQVKSSPVASPHHLVISPYPQQYVQSEVTTDGTTLTVRPIKPEDAPLLVDLFETLSPTSIYQRFFSPMKSLPHHMLVRFTQIDYDREMALVALDESAQQEKMLGVARVIGKPDGDAGEFAVVVGDPWQGKGVGAELLKRCLRIVKERGMQSVWGMVLTENKQMLKLARKIGFQISQSPEGNEYEMTLDLKDAQL